MVATPYAEMNEEEKLVFAGLLRLMSRMDGVLSHEEVGSLSEIAKEIGEPQLFARLNDSVHLEHTDLTRMALDVRPQFRRYILSMLERIAISDGVDEMEQELLWWLESRWGLPRQP